MNQSIEEFRDEWDRKMTRLFARLLAEQRRRLLAVLGVEAKAARDVLTDEYWESENRLMTEVLRRPMIQMTGEIIERLAEMVPTPADLTIINQRVLDWVHGYTFELIQDVNGTTRQAVRDAVSRYFVTPHEPIADITEELQRIQEFVDGELRPVFGPVRAEMIAITETTRAIDRADQITMEEIARAGFRYRDIWYTANDERVCEVCGPRHGKGPEEWDTPEHPPLHPRCRCEVMHEMIG